MLQSVSNGLCSTRSNVVGPEPHLLHSMIDLEERSYDYRSIVANPAEVEIQLLKFISHQLLSILHLVVLRQQHHEIAFYHRGRKSEQKRLSHSKAKETNDKRTCFIDRRRYSLAHLDASRLGPSLALLGF